MRDETTFDPDTLPGVCVPNWFYKSHFEEFLGRSMTDEEFDAASQWVAHSLDDKISDLVRDELLCWHEENEWMNDHLEELP